jgi:N-acetylneuraminate synthase
MIKNKPYLIAEVGQAHEGSINMAHNFIREVKYSGASAVKFQCHFADHESSKFDKFRVKPQFNCFKSRYDYWKKMEFSGQEWSGLFKHSKSLGLDFICSPFSEYSVDLISKTGVDIFKVASGEILNVDLIKRIKKTKKKLILSTGLTKLSELKTILKYIEKKKILSILYCVSKYPTPPIDINLESMKLIKKYFRTETGISDHSGTIYPSLAAYLLGGNFFEVHVTFDKKILNFDATSSINFFELKQLKEGLDFFNVMKTSKSSIRTLSSHQLKYRKLFSRNAVVKKFLKKGSKIKEKDFIFLKPKIGIGNNELHKYIGKKTKKNLDTNHYLNIEDLQ